MKNNDLIERYIYAVTKNLPLKTRNDVANELCSIISDMLDERCGEVTPTEKDIKVVLTEFGTPRELEEKYSPDNGKALISGSYFTKYKLVLKIVLVSVALGMTMAGLISAVATQSVWYLAFTEWFGTLWGGLAGAFAFVTVLFVLFQYRGVKLDNFNDSIDNLPPVPNNNSTIKPWEAIIGIVFSVIFTVVFLGFPKIISAVIYNGNTYNFVPIFNIVTVKNFWYIFVSLGFIGIAKECVKLIDGRYTTKVMITVIATDLLTIALTFAWLFNDNIMNEGFVTYIKNAIGPDAATLINGQFDNFKLAFLAIIIFALSIDMITTVIKTMKNR